MIYVEVKGRCGNQLFRYAFARYVQIKSGDKELCFNFQGVYELAHTGKGFVNELKNFNVVSFEEYTKSGKLLMNETNILQKMVCIINTVYLKYLSKYSRQVQADRSKRFVGLANYFGIYWLREGYVPMKIHKRKNQFISGNFECKLFFDEIRPYLLEELAPKEAVLPKNKTIMKNILDSESVCISVRRGDFFNKHHAKSFAVCNEAYYSKAKDRIHELVDNPKFFCFSDDIEWCKKNLFKESQDIVFISQDMPVYETLRLMYSCKHFILSNSTFSWWGQYLSQNDKKVVISPSRWNNDDFYTPLMDSEWIKIEV